MYIYLYIGIVMLLNNLFSKHFFKYMNILIILIITGFAYKIHNDFAIYERVYNLFRNNLLNTASKINFELGYKYLNFIFSKNLNFYEFKFILYIINIFLINLGIKIFGKKNEKFIWSFLYFYGPFYFIWLTALRQGIAISIIIFSYKYLYENKYFKYSLGVILATLFHTSSIILIGLIFIQKIKIDTKNDFKKYLLFLAGTTLFFSFGFLKIISILENIIPKLGNYLEKGIINENISILNIVFYNLILIFSIYLYIKNKKNYLNKFIIKFFLLFIVIINLSFKINIMYRLTPYLAIFLGAQILEIIKVTKKNYLKIITLLFFFIFFNLRTIYKVNKKDDRLIPYRSYLETIFYKIPYRETAEFKHVKSRE